MLRMKIINIRQAEIIDSACGKYFDASQKVSYKFDGPAAMVFQVALPDNDNIPSQRNQLRSVPVITLNIFKKFFLPEFFIRGGSWRISASGMPMPEAAMHKDDSPIFL